MAGPRHYAVDRGAGGGSPPVHAAPRTPLRSTMDPVQWTGRAGGRAAVHGGPRAGAGAGRRRRRHGRPRRARSGGAAGRGETSRGHGQGRRDTTSAMASSPPRNDEVKEKLDGGACGGGFSKAAARARRVGG